MSFVNYIEMRSPNLEKTTLENSYLKAMTTLSRDLKVMFRSYKGHKYIPVVITEVTSFMVAIPIHHSRSEGIGYALIQHIFNKDSMLEYIIMDQNSGFMPTLVNYLFRKLGINVMKVVLIIINLCMQNME